MSWNLRAKIGRISSWRATLGFRLTAGYALAGLVMVFVATAALYFVLVKELERSTDLFLADKVNVIRTMLRDRPVDEDALREEVELESAARQYEQFYIRLLDERNIPLMTTPGMSEQLELEKFPSPAETHLKRTLAMTGRRGQSFRVTTETVPV